MTHNVDTLEVKKFEDNAYRWWDPESEYKPLHQLNPVRLDYIERQAGLRGLQVLDVGCGGGLLSEGMAARGAKVTGIDAGKAPIEVAKLHLLESGLKVDYLQTTAEVYAQDHNESFDLVTCLEMLEHVPDPASVIAACATMVKPGGKLVFSTLNRNPKSYAMAIVGAEYILKWLAKGTHDYKKFIRPSELAAWARAAGLDVIDIRGMSYNPIGKEFFLSHDIDVNYLLTAVKR